MWSTTTDKGLTPTWQQHDTLSIQSSVVSNILLRLKLEFFWLFFCNNYWSPKNTYLLRRFWHTACSELILSTLHLFRSAGVKDILTHKFKIHYRKWQKPKKLDPVGIGSRETWPETWVDMRFYTFQFDVLYTLILAGQSFVASKVNLYFHSIDHWSISWVDDVCWLLNYFAFMS